MSLARHILPPNIPEDEKPLKRKSSSPIQLGTPGYAQKTSVGIGKTMKMEAVGEKVQERSPLADLLYLRCEFFILSFLC